MTFGQRVRTSLIASVIVVSACLGWSTSVARATEADGRTSATAFVIAADGTPFASATFDQSHAAGHEWVKFPVISGRAYRVSLEWTGDAGVRTFLCDAGVNELFSYLGWVRDQASVRWVRANSDGFYYVDQWNPSGSPSYGTYTLSVTSQPFDDVVTTISGRVTQEPGVGAGGALVRVWRSDPPFNDPVATISTTADGLWNAPVLPGSYVVRFDDPADVLTGEYFDHLTHVIAGTDVPTSVNVLPGTPASGVNGFLARRGSVVGRVVRSTDGTTGISGVTVTSRWAVGSRTAVTGPDGAFVIEGIDTGWPQELLVQDVAGWHTSAAATLPYTVGPGGTFRPTLTMLPDEVAVGSIAGLVTDALTGAVLPGIDAVIVAPDGTTIITATVTGPDGRYRFDGVSAGGCLVRFSDPTSTHTSRSVTANVLAGQETTVDMAMPVGVLPPAPLTTTHVSITANHKVVAPKHSVYFSGTVSPDQPTGASVVVYVQKRGSHVWTRLGRRTLTAHHHWSFKYTPKSRGIVYLRARFAANETYAASSSAPKRLTVR